MSEEAPRIGRRACLLLSAASVAGLAGCQGSAEDETPATTSAPATPSPTRTSTPTSNPTASPTDAATDADGGPGAESAGDEATEDSGVADAEDALATLDFEGDWFDTHAHWGMADAFGYDDFTIDGLTTIQRRHGVGATVLFTFHVPFVREYGSTVETLARDGVDYLPFFFPGAFDSREDRESFYEDRKEVFYGLGEVTFYSGAEQGLRFTDDPIPEYFEMSAAEDLVLMLHPTEEQAADVGPMLSAFPDARLLLHGFELAGMGDTLPTLLAEHENLYWTHDTATMTGGLMVRSNGQADFVDRFEANRDRYLDRAAQVLPPLLEAAPDRVMWGTDVVADWHVDPDVYGRLVAFSEDVIDSLPDEHRDPYAYENAVALFDA